jgi:hypothetical protein
LAVVAAETGGELGSGVEGNDEQASVNGFGGTPGSRGPDDQPGGICSNGGGPENKSIINGSHNLIYLAADRRSTAWRILPGGRLSFATTTWLSSSTGGATEKFLDYYLRKITNYRVP